MKVTIEHNNGFTWVFDTTGALASSDCRGFDNEIIKLIDEYGLKVTNDMYPTKEGER